MVSNNRSIQEGGRRLRLICRGFMLVWESARGWTAVQAGTVVIKGVMPAATLYLTKATVDEIALVLGQAGADSDYSRLLMLALFVALVTLLSMITNAVSAYATEAQSSAVSNHVQGIMQKKAAGVDYGCYEDPSFHNTMQMAMSGALSRPVSIVRNLNSSAQSALALCTVAAVLVFSHPYLVPVVVLAVIPGTLARIWNSRAIHAWNLDYMEKSRYSTYLHGILTRLNFAKEIRMYGNAPEIRGRWRRLKGEIRASKLNLAARRQKISLLADLGSYIVAAGGIGLVYVNVKDAREAVTLGSLALVYKAFSQAKGSLSTWLGSITSLYEDSLFLEHFDTFMKLPDESKRPRDAVPCPARITSKISIRGVNFAYPGTSRQVLKNVSFDVKAGEHVALAGRNGAGKTTLAKLLCRLYDPDEGAILIDDTDIRNYEPRDYRNMIGILFQDYCRYFMTAEDNVRMGDIHVPEGSERVRDAAREADADTVIESLQSGYKTILGRLFEGGVELSVGQWQRIALARASLRNAPVVILDEHTSALDAKAEREVLERLFDVFKHKTVVIISHRLSTVKMVDRIIMLEDGAVAEQGSHDELIRSRGAYAELFAEEERG